MIDDDGTWGWGVLIGRDDGDAEPGVRPEKNKREGRTQDGQSLSSHAYGKSRAEHSNVSHAQPACNWKVISIHTHIHTRVARSVARRYMHVGAGRSTVFLNSKTLCPVAGTA